MNITAKFIIYQNINIMLLWYKYCILVGIQK